MTEHVFVDACFFKNFAAGDGLVIFDSLFPDGALTGGISYHELSVKHAKMLPGRLTIQPISSIELLDAIADIQLRYHALSTADAELLYLAKTCHGRLFTDELPLYNACQAHGISCRRFLGTLREAVMSQGILPADAIAFLHCVLAINPPRRFPSALVAELFAEWETLLIPAGPD